MVRTIGDLGVVVAGDKSTLISAQFERGGAYLLLVSARRYELAPDSSKYTLRRTRHLPPFCHSQGFPHRKGGWKGRGALSIGPLIGLVEIPGDYREQVRAHPTISKEVPVHLSTLEDLEDVALLKVHSWF